MRKTPPEPFQPDLDILVTELASFLREAPDDPVPSHRKMVQEAANGVLSPPLEKRNGRWTCRRSRVPELKRKLLALGLLPPPRTAAEPAAA